MLASLTKFSCVFDKLPNTINKRHFSSNKVVPWPRSFCLGVGFMASYFPHEILSKRSTVDFQNLKLWRGTRRSLGVFSYPSVWTWGIPCHPKMACPSCSPYVLLPKLWFYNFYTVFVHFAQNVSFKTIHNGKPCSRPAFWYHPGNFFKKGHMFYSFKKKLTKEKQNFPSVDADTKMLIPRFKNGFYNVLYKQSKKRLIKITKFFSKCWSSLDHWSVSSHSVLLI